MSDFKRDLNISDLLLAVKNEEETVQYAAKEVYRRIIKLEASSDGELEEVLRQLEGIARDEKADPEDLDCAIQDLTDWGDDDNRMSIQTEYVLDVEEPVPDYLDFA